MKESFQAQNNEPKKEVNFDSLKHKIKTLLKVGTASVLLSGLPDSGPKDYSFEKDFGHAYSHARTVGEKEFKYKGERYTTLSENLPGVPIKQRDNFTGNSMSKAGLAYAEFEANGAGLDESFYSTEHPYGKLFDLYRYYFGQPLENGVLSISKYSPENSKDKGTRYISINDKNFLEDVIKEYNQLKKPLNIGESAFVSGYGRPESLIQKAQEKLAKNNTTSALGNFKIGRGVDENGEYISYYDLFDYRSGQADKVIGAKSFEVYGRIYVVDDGTGKLVIKE
ncbi:hypothetical protein IT400_03105 [Candidatus Nomurabacteria bacterium]|nr:hypothetical protein [Candidatus Nomurabacteria bacterium]